MKIGLNGVERLLTFDSRSKVWRCRGANGAITARRFGLHFHPFGFAQDKPSG
jgi:hypothetical protein